MTEYVLVDLKIHVPQKLDAKGRCCGVKPLRYKHDPHFFCCRCNRAYSLDIGHQIPNWAWKEVAGGFQSTTRRKVGT